MILRRKRIVKLSRFITLLALSLFAGSLTAGEIDWQEVRGLKDQAFIDYVQGLDLKGQQALDFWKRLPVSNANKQVYRLFRREAFTTYLKNYPRPEGRVESFTPGMGTQIIGPISGQSLKLPFTSYYPLPEGPIGDPNKTYNIGYTIHGLGHPWLLNNADTAQWEADRHSNVNLVVMDPKFDNAKQVAQIDNWVQKKFDGILVWPMQEAQTGAPVDRAYQAGIPVVTVDRRVGSTKVLAQVTGNFPANGAQQGAYLVYRMLQERGKVGGKILLIRKPQGSTADALRTGHFLKIISYFPSFEIVDSLHNSSSRKTSHQQVSDALEKHPQIDIIFCTGAEQGMGAVQAVDEAQRWDSGGYRLIILSNDDLYEALEAMREDKIGVTAPYTPLLGGLGLRVLLKSLIGEVVPKNVVTPDLPMVTREPMDIFGIQTLSIDDWRPYSYGRK